MVFATRPLRQLEGAAIAVTSHTSTSGLLLRLVLEQHYRLQPLGYTPYDQPEAAAAAGADALLLIGDDALRFRQATTRYPYEADLAFEWWLWQHLPFVFAVWAVRRDATAQRKKQLEAALGRALTANSGQLDAIAQERARPLGLPPEDLCAYLEAFHYRLGPAEEAGIEKFRELAKGHGLL
jgi:chorismate dehydratase